MSERGIDNVNGGGPAVVTTYDYWLATGLLRTVYGVNPLGYDVQNLGYTWDGFGNLRQRRDQSGPKNLTEDFTYDDLNRLKTATALGQAANVVGYDALGNIKTKSGITGEYAYDPNRPHVLLSTGDATYTYTTTATT